MTQTLRSCAASLLLGCIYAIACSASAQTTNSDVLRRTGKAEYLAGNFQTAEVLLRRATEVGQEQDDPNVLIGPHSVPADGQELTLADVDRIISQAFRSGNFGEAARYLRIALQEAEAGGASAEERVAILGNLGEMLRSARQYEEAEPYFNRALDILRTSSIVDKSYLAVILVNLGTLYQETGRYPLSESSLKQALSLTERELGANHWNMSKVHNSLGILYSSTNKRKEAEASFRKALALEEKQPVQDRVLAPTLGNLAGLYIGKKRWDRAEPLLIRALGISESYFGDVHPETAVILDKLGLAYSGQRKLKLAEASFRRALEVRHKLFGPDDQTVASTSFFLAQVLTAQGSFDEAKLRYTESLQVREKIFGPKAAEVATTLEEFAKLLRKTRNNEEASGMEARAKYIRAEINYTIKVRTGQRE